MKGATVILAMLLAFAAGTAEAAEKMAKKFGAGPAIQGNSDPAMHPRRKAMQRGMHKKM